MNEQEIDMIKTIEKANEQIAAVREWVLFYEGEFLPMDLKLHEASFYVHRGMEEDYPLCTRDMAINGTDYFQIFCEASYNDMIESLEEWYNIDFQKMRHPIGRTSQFFLHDQNIIGYDPNGIKKYGTDIEIPRVVENWMEYEWNSNCSYFDPEGNVRSDIRLDEYPDNRQDEIDYIASGKMFEEFTKHFEDVIHVYDYIREFKENQVTYFKDFLEHYESELSAELEDEISYGMDEVDKIASLAEEIGQAAAAVVSPEDQFELRTRLKKVVSELEDINSSYLLAEKRLTDLAPLPQGFDVEPYKQTESVFSISKYGEETFYRNTSGFSAEELCRAYASCESPFADMAQYGQQISSEQFAAIEQSGNFAFSVDFSEKQIRIFDGEKSEYHHPEDFAEEATEVKEHTITQLRKPSDPKM